jgi:ParB family chromosome partitioning protein
MAQPEEQLVSLPTAAITPSPFQPRRHFDEAALDELAASIRQQGIIQPIVVRRVGNRYELIAGERRWRACRRAGIAEIPAIVRLLGDEKAMEAALVENLQREDISVVETARAYHRLNTDFSYSQTEIALRTGKSRVAVTNTLRLLQLPDAVLELIEQEEITEGHARALLALPYPSLQIEVAEWISRNAVPVRDAENRVRQLLARSGDAAYGESVSATRADPQISALEARLRGLLGTKVELHYRSGKGAIKMEFYSDEDLNRILELLGVG